MAGVSIHLVVTATPSPSHKLMLHTHREDSYSNMGVLYILPSMKTFNDYCPCQILTTGVLCLSKVECRNYTVTRVYELTMESCYVATFACYSVYLFEHDTLLVYMCMWELDCSCAIAQEFQLSTINMEGKY